MFNLMADLLSGAVLQPLLDLLPNPDTINLFLDLGFSPEPSKKFEAGCGTRVEYLHNFVIAHHTPSQSVSWVKYCVFGNYLSTFPWIKSK